MPSPPCDAVERAVDLGEELEDGRERTRRDARCPSSRTRNTTIVAVALGATAGCGRPRRCTSPRCSGGWRAPAETRAVAAQRRRASAAASPSARGRCCVDERPARLDRRVGRSAAASTVSSLQLDLAARDARDVEQVVDEADQLLHLPVDHVARPARARSACSRTLQQVHARCGSARAGCGARARASRGTRSCAGRPPGGSGDRAARCRARSPHGRRGRRRAQRVGSSLTVARRDAEHKRAERRPRAASGTHSAATISGAVHRRGAVQRPRRPADARTTACRRRSRCGGSRSRARSARRAVRRATGWRSPSALPVTSDDTAAFRAGRR